MASRAITYSDFYCVRCTHKVTLPRKTSKQRERSHLKSIHCIHCKTQINHYEVRDCDTDFNLNEFKDAVNSGMFKDKEEMLKNEKGI